MIVFRDRKDEINLTLSCLAFLQNMYITSCSTNQERYGAYFLPDPMFVKFILRYCENDQQFSQNSRLYFLQIYVVICIGSSCC